MKRVTMLLLLIFLTPFFGHAQTSENFDYISPFYEGFAAVKKGNQWAFINTEGTIVVGFRDDLKTTKMKNGTYPVLKNNRCIIIKKANKISYFGYIDASGKTIIAPVFLNALNFQNNVAIVLRLHKERRGYNNVLGKDVMYCTYSEVVIGKKGDVKENLTRPKNIVLEKKMLAKASEITSKILSEKLIAVLDENQKWAIKKISTESKRKDESK